MVVEFPIDQIYMDEG